MTAFKHVSYGLRYTLRDNVWSRRRTRGLLEHDCWTPARLHALRDELLYRTLHVAQRTIARYWQLPLPASAAEALACLRRDYPIVSKTDLLRHRNLYYPHGGRSLPWTIKGKTSGTTGTPLEVFRSLDSVRWEQAFKKRHWGWSGFRDGMRRASLRGDAVVPVDRTKPPFWLFNHFGNQLLLSSRHLQDPFLGQIVETLGNFRPYLLEAYPSTAFVLASYLERQHSELRIPFVYTGSEILHAYQRELIEARIGKVMDFYGMAERVAFASECEAGNLHVNSDYSFVEIVDDAGEETEGPGYVVGTTFHNLEMPLIRYRLSDRAAWKSGSCPCGRCYPMMEAVSGKFEDVIFGAAGEPVSPSLVTFAFKGVSNIECSQVAQVSPGIWEVRIVPATGYSDADGQQVVKNIHSMVDAKIMVRTKTVREIPRTAAGKYRWVVNETGSGGSAPS
jgi:phenylacetate-CoA ligase